ncbi:MAG: hypothetical protein ACXV2J_05940 [Actinomycetes bacterium]
MPGHPERMRVVVVDAPVAQRPADITDAVAQAVRVGFGLVSLGVGVALRTLAEAQSATPERATSVLPVAETADALIATAWGAARLSGRVAASGVRLAAPVLGLALRPPLVPRQLQAGQALDQLVARWERDRPDAVRTLGRWSTAALPGAMDAALAQVDVDRVVAVVLDRLDLDVVVDAALARIDLEALLATVLRRVDLDAVVAAVLEDMDLTAAAERAVAGLDVDRLIATVLQSADLDRAVATSLGQLDLDQLVYGALDRLDIDALVATVLRRLDVDAVAMSALDRLQLARVVSAVLDQLDLTQLVLDRVDLESIVNRALERLDITAVVVEQVDLGVVVAAALDRLDLTQIVLQKVDLIGVAEYVVEGIDLPEIIRDSTGSVASEAVRGLRMQGVDADDAVARVVDRMLRRRRERRTLAPPEPGPEPPVGNDRNDTFSETPS